MKEQEEKLCSDAVLDILSVKLLGPERISYVIKTYNELYENTNYEPYGPIGDFFLLYIKLCDFYSLVKRSEVVKNALEEFNQINHLSTGNIIKWLVKYEDEGLYIRNTVSRTKVENYDELLNGSILLDAEFDIRIVINNYIPHIDFANTFNKYYDSTMDKYRTDSDEETYIECGVEYYKSNNEQRRLLNFVRHLINAPIDDVFLTNEKSFDLNKLKNYVPMRVERHSSTPSPELQAAHNLFHEEQFEEAKLKYELLLKSRNDYQEAWIGLTISNFILGDYEGAYIASTNLSTYQYKGLINYIEKYRQSSGMSENDFYISDKTCEESIEDFENKNDKLLWLAENRELYNSISIRPEGLPSIASCCLNGKHYENISIFHRLYCNTFTDENILETKTHLEAVIHFIEKMNIQKLDELLLLNRYAGISKSKFLTELKGVFQEFNDAGDTVLYASQGVCKGCKVGCSGYTFLSNKSRNYIDLVIVSENDKVTDIYECNQFKNERYVKSMLGKRIKFYNDDMPF
jgi:hypothetical protein